MVKFLTDRSEARAQIIAAMPPIFEAIEPRTMFSTFSVTNTLDSGVGSLRDAIALANTTPNAGGADLINFKINVAGVQTISLLSALPTITEAVTIDGFTQAGSSANTLAVGSDAHYTIDINGKLAGNNARGFDAESGSATIRGMALSGFNGEPIFLRSGTAGSVIEGNFIGLDSAGKVDGSQNNGVVVTSSAGNRIGGSSPAARNVIVGHAGSGITILGAESSGNTVSGNYIGVNPAGTTAAPNGDNGVTLDNGAHGNTIGGPAAGDRNVISGNLSSGVAVFTNGTRAFGNTIQGNLIGTNATGTAAIGNAVDGVTLLGDSNIVDNNLISGNAKSGVKIGVEDFSALASDNVIRKNKIGTDITGNTDIENSGGVVVASAQRTHVGEPNSGNLISGNGLTGVRLNAFGDNNSIQGNRIGTNAGGTAVIDNGGGGIFIQRGNATLIGGTEAGAGNLISGNENNGINAFGSQVFGLVLQGNLIGTNFDGTLALSAPSGGQGLQLSNCDGLTIGGSSAGARNIISGNEGRGISLVDVKNAVIAGNYIGTNASGTAAIPNADEGLEMTRSVNTRIGGTDAGSGNIISGNQQSGVIFSDSADTRVEGNFIGTDKTGTLPIPNGESGVLVGTDNTFSTIGGATSASRNIIAFNKDDGVLLESGHTAVRLNSIFSNAQLGIDINFDEVTPNDAGDADTGTNNLQNYPVLSSAVSTVGGVTIDGGLNSTPNHLFLVDLYSNDALDASGFGEGKTYLGTKTVLTDAFGNAVFSASLIGVVAPGQFITATATAPRTTTENDTSEFSQAIDVAVPPAPPPAPPAISIGDVSANEGNNGSTAFTFTVTRSVGTGASSVAFSTTFGSTDANDLAAESGTVNFAAGETSKTVTVNVNGDLGVEADETFTVNLSNAVNATIADAQGVGTIKNDDVAPVGPTLSVNDVAISEGNSGTTTLTFTVTLSQKSNKTVSVNFATQNDSADSSDFTAKAGSLSFAPGQTSKNVSITIKGDKTVELDETFKLQLAGATNATIVDGEGIGMIKNDDVAATPKPKIYIDDVTDTEGQSGTKTFTFKVWLDTPSTKAVTADFCTSNGTAKASDNDYQAKSGTITFAPGETVKYITITVIGDVRKEQDECFFVNLGNVANADVARNQATGKIKNDD